MLPPPCCAQFDYPLTTGLKAPAYWLAPQQLMAACETRIICEGCDWLRCAYTNFLQACQAASSKCLRQQAHLAVSLFNVLHDSLTTREEMSGL
jgi:hypothetical protein